MNKLTITFYGPLEEVSLKRTNQSIKNILNVLDFVSLSDGDKSKLRKIILDEINSMRVDMLDYFNRVQDG